MKHKIVLSNLSKSDLKKIDKTIEQIKKEISVYGVIYKERKKIIDGRSRGYFEGSEDSSPSELVIVKNKSVEWFPILIHEYCHFKQWKEPNSIFMRGNIDLFYHFDEYISGKKVRLDRAIASKNHIKKIEFDCDKRAINFIKKNKLPIDVEKYIKEAWLYLWYHDLAIKLKRWPKLNITKMITIPEIYEALPSNFRKKRTVVPKKILEIMEKYEKRRTKQSN